jgi:transcriptional regulator with XRE-family HTH domain
VRRLGTALRDRRTAAHLTQRELSERVGVSQTELSRLERGLGAGTGIDVWSACAAALGLQFAAFFEQAAGASLPRDIEHLRRQNLVVSLSAAGGWTAVPEGSIDPGRWSRSIDVLLRREARREAAVIEVWDLLLDGGEAMRGLAAKVEAIRAQLGEGWRVQGLLVVRRTHRNRALVGELRDLFAARYPASSAAWLRALEHAAVPMPPDSGFAWTSVDGTRLVAARL